MKRKRKEPPSVFDVIRILTPKIGDRIRSGVSDILVEGNIRHLVGTDAWQSYVSGSVNELVRSLLSKYRDVDMWFKVHPSFNISVYYRKRSNGDTFRIKVKPKAKARDWSIYTRESEEDDRIYKGTDSKEDKEIIWMEEG